MEQENRSYSFLGDQLTTIDKAEALRRVPLFSELSQDYLLGIARHGREVQANSGDVLVQQGDAGNDFGLILDGTVRVEQNGRTVARLDAGDFYGELSLLDGKPRSASVIADTPARLLVVDGMAFGQLMESQPGMMRRILATLVQRLRERGEEQT